MKNKSFFILLTVLIIISGGCAGKGRVKPAAEAPSKAVALTAVNFGTDSVEFKASGQFTYTIFKPSDPYKVVVELPDVSAGPYTGRLLSKTPGISEVVVAEMGAPASGVRMEILMEDPSELEPSYMENTLALRIKTEEDAKVPGPPKYEAAPKEELRLAEMKEAEMKEERPAPEETAWVAEKSKESAFKSAQSASKINDINIDYTDGLARLTIKGDGAMQPNIFALDRRVVIDIPGVSMRASLLPKSVSAPIKGIRSGAYVNKARLVIDLKDEADFDSNTLGDAITVTLISKSPSWESVGEPPPAPAAAPGEEVPAGVKYTGQKISLDFQNTDIVPIFRLLGEVSGYNVVIHPSVSGTTNLKLKNVPWDQVLDIMLEQHSLEKSIEGNILKVASSAEFDKWRDEEAKRRESQQKLEPLQREVIKLNYAIAEDISAAVTNAKILNTARESITIDKRMNTLIVNATEGGIDKIKELIRVMDVSKPQVMIEAKFVQISSTYTRDLGIRWGGTLVASNWPPVSGNFSVNTPTVAAGSAATAEGGALNMTIGTANTVQINLSLSALESTNKARTLSNPKVLTLDNEAAFIEQADKITIQTVSAEGTRPFDITAGLSMTVTPTIAPDGYVKLNINAENGRVVSVTPQIQTFKQTVKTSALVKDGDTLVLGGIFQQNESEGESSVTGLGKIPILGGLFRKKDRRGPDIVEVMILITPKIIKQEGR